MFLAAGANGAFLPVADFNESLFQIADALIDEAAVFFELGFAGAAQADAAFGLPRQVRPHFS